jgi:mono/diheme cytochrome c family protein
MWRIPNIACLVSLLVLSACRQDMQDQPRYKPLAGTRIFPDGRSARPIPAGTVARDEEDADDVVHTGKTNGDWITTLPVPLTVAQLHRGQERFDIFCAPCHSRIGDGNGMIEQRGFLRPVDLHTDRVRQEPPGYIFDVITNGFGAMPDYKDQIPVDDRWAIIAYLRALQLSRNATLNDVPADVRNQVANLPQGGSMLPPGQPFQPIAPPTEGQR